MFRVEQYIVELTVLAAEKEGDKYRVHKGAPPKLQCTAVGAPEPIFEWSCSVGNSTAADCRTYFEYHTFHVHMLIALFFTLLSVC